MTREATSAQSLIVALTSAVTIRALYPGDHPRVKKATQDLLKALASTLTARKTWQITYLVVDDDVVVDDRPLRRGTVHVRNFVRILNRFQVQQLTLTTGLDEAECSRLLAGLCGEGALVSSDCVQLGRIDVGPPGSGGGDDDEVSGPSAGGGLSDEELDTAQEVFLSLRSQRQGSVETLDRLVWHFIEALSRTARAFLLLAPAKGFDEYLFVHSANVALLAVAQARALGIGGGALHEIGVAALLHDIGKLSLPREILDRRGRLSDEDWRVVRTHPELGSAHLSGIEGLTPLAILVAFEHHLRWDGRPNFPRLPEPRRPNLASQITAVADTYDAMVAVRPPGSFVRRAALDVWRHRAGTFLDPFLVGNFVLLVGQAAGDGRPPAEAQAPTDPP